MSAKVSKVKEDKSIYLIWIQHVKFQYHLLSSLLPAEPRSVQGPVTLSFLNYISQSCWESLDLRNLQIGLD